MKNKINKKFINKSITFALIFIFYIVLEILSQTGNITSLMRGLLVPFCIYSIIAVALNLVVGISGELSLGHAGFMCIGAFSSAIFTRYLKFQGVEGLHVFIIAIIIGIVVSALFGFLIWKFNLF